MIRAANYLLIDISNSFTKVAFATQSRIFRPTRIATAKLTSTYIRKFIARRKIDMCKIDIRQKLRAGTPGRLFQLARDCAHPADRHFPFAGFVTDQVIKKTPVLHE